MRKSQEFLEDSPRDYGRTGAPPKEGSEPQFVSALTPEVLAYYEAVGKQIEVALGEKASRNLIFAGAIGGDGITTVVAQYGEMLARRGERVLLIDGNPRHPGLHEHLGVREAPGLSELISGSTPREMVVHATRLPNLSVVPLGRCVDRSQAEKITERLGDVETAFMTSYDYVLVDVDFIGSPFFSPAAVSAGDGVVLVIRAGKTNREIAGRACETVRRIGGEILGVILNRREFPIPDFIYRRL
jgi:Mrp family chromosome partitioning ATPase